MLVGTTVFSLISVKGIRNSERLFVNTKLCSYIELTEESVV